MQALRLYWLRLSKSETCGWGVQGDRVGMDASGKQGIGHARGRLMWGNLCATHTTPYGGCNAFHTCCCIKQSNLAFCYVFQDGEYVNAVHSNTLEPGMVFRISGPLPNVLLLLCLEVHPTSTKSIRGIDSPSSWRRISPKGNKGALARANTHNKYPTSIQ